MRLILVEPYAGGSHRAWAEGYARHSRHDVHLVTHEGRFWRWRMRGGALTLAEEIEQVVARVGRPDALLVSDMVDLPALLGFSRHVIGDAPVALYLHENQLLYPAAGSSGRSVGPWTADREAWSWVNWLSLAAADRVLFNSAHHRDALLAALPSLLARAPDRDHGHRLEAVVRASSVLHVGVELAGLADGIRPPQGDAPLVLWNQRWDHDKDPTSFFAMLDRLAGEGVGFRVALAGENERRDPREFLEGRRRLGDRVVHVGHLPRDDYVQLLLASDVVVSTASHEFFGVATVEAIAAGAVPVLPDRLSYPELLPPWARPTCLHREGEGTDHLRRVLVDLEGARAAVAGLREEMRRFSWETLAPVYDATLAGLAGGRVPSAP